MVRFRIPPSLLAMGLVMLLAACTAFQENVDTLPAYPQSTSIIIPSREITSTAIPVTKTPTTIPLTTEAISSSPTVTVTPLPEIDIQSVNVTNDPYSERQIGGYLVLMNFSDGIIYYLDMTTGNKKHISSLSTVTYCGNISPDHQKFICDTATDLIVVNNDGRVTYTKPWKKEWHLIGGWISNEKLSILADPPDDYAPLQNLPTTVFDITTNQETTILPDFPKTNIFETFHNYGPLAYTGASYNPNLELVVYEAFDEYRYLVLWDRTANQEVARVLGGDQVPYPQWSADGSRAIVVGSNQFPSDNVLQPIERDSEIFMMSKAGGLQQLTNLEDDFENATEIRSLGWSPDEKSIAFGFRSDHSACSNGCIGILDIDTQSIQLFNFPGYRVGRVDDPVYSIIWSPQGQQLLLYGVSIETGNNYMALVFDVEHSSAFEVASDVRIFGWMLAP